MMFSDRFKNHKQEEFVLYYNDDGYFLTNEEHTFAPVVYLDYGEKFSVLIGSQWITAYLDKEKDEYENEIDVLRPDGLSLEKILADIPCREVRDIRHIFKHENYTPSRRIGNKEDTSMHKNNTPRNGIEAIENIRNKIRINRSIKKQTNEADVEFENLVNECRPHHFKRSGDVSRYIVNNKLGEKYKNISGYIYMEDGGVIEGGIDPYYYRKLCYELDLGGPITDNKVVDFKPFSSEYDED